MASKDIIEQEKRKLEHLRSSLFDITYGEYSKIEESAGGTVQRIGLEKGTLEEMVNGGKFLCVRKEDNNAVSLSTYTMYPSHSYAMTVVIPFITMIVLFDLLAMVGAVLFNAYYALPFTFFILILCAYFAVGSVIGDRVKRSYGIYDLEEVELADKHTVVLADSFINKSVHGRISTILTRSDILDNLIQNKDFVYLVENYANTHEEDRQIVAMIVEEKRQADIRDETFGKRRTAIKTYNPNNIICFPRILKIPQPLDGKDKVKLINRHQSARDIYRKNKDISDVDTASFLKINREKEI